MEVVEAGKTTMQTQDSRDDTVHALFGGSTMLAASAFGNGLGYLLGIVLARLLGAEDFGIYAVGMAVFNVLALVALCGADTAVIKFLSEAIHRDDRPHAARTLVVVLAYAMIAGTLAAGLLLWSSHTWLLDLYRRPQLIPILAVLALNIPLVMTVTVFIASFQAEHAFRPIVTIRYLWEPLGKIALAIIAVGAGWGLLGVVGAFTATSLISVSLAAYAARTMLLEGLGRRAPYGDLIAALTSYGLPLSIMTIVGVVAPRTDVLFLGYWVEAAKVGLYQAAYQTAAILTLIAAALDMAFAPLSARLFATQDVTRVRSLYQTVSRWLLTVSLPVALIFIVFGSDILLLFGPAFSLAGECLLILAIGHGINNWTTCAHTVLLMSGHARLAMWNTIGLGLLLVTLNGILIPRFGITGAALAVAVSMGLGGLLRLTQVWWLHGLHPFSIRLLKPISAGLATIVLGYLTKGLLRPDLLLGAVFTAGTCYVVLLWIMKIEEDDRLALVGLKHRVLGPR
jgi:O-antigen/teichoic acid export membrane protein